MHLRGRSPSEAYRLGSHSRQGRHGGSTERAGAGSGQLAESERNGQLAGKLSLSGFRI